jgi:hypothetical protein
MRVADIEPSMQSLQRCLADRTPESYVCTCSLVDGFVVPIVYVAILITKLVVVLVCVRDDV